MSVNLLDMGGWSVVVSLVVVTVAALNLVLDFAFIDQQVKEGAPKYIEWYGGFGLLVTLVWLYVEIVRLLVILTPSDVMSGYQKGGSDETWAFQSSHCTDPTVGA
jgi:uncharacterized YccA/Bax inhibitor family protein